MTSILWRGLPSGAPPGKARGPAHRLEGDIARRGLPAPITAGLRWVVERTTAWTNAHKKLVWCSERRAVVIAFWMALSAVIIIVGRLVREAWTRYRWDERPRRRP